MSNNQRGTALLLSLLVMTGLVITGVTLGTIVISEIRQSKQIDNAVVAYYAAESGAEHLVFNWRDTRDNGLFTNPDCNENSDVGWKCSMLTASTSQLVFSLGQLETEQIPLYLANQLNIPSEVESMRITWQDADLTNLAEPWLEVTLIGWSANDTLVNYQQDVEQNPNGRIKKIFKCSYPVLGNPGCDIIMMNDFNKGDSYIVRIRPLYDAVEQVTVSFYNYDNGVQQKDLGSYIKAADFTGTYNGIKQAVRIQFPVVDPSSSLFDFVFFSEESLLKRIF